MREDLPSTTAAAVALARGIASLRAPRGARARSIAARMLPGLGRVLEGLGPIAARTTTVSRALRLASLGLVDHLALRTAAIDDALRAGCARDVPQVVLLGAGLDSRAWRMPELAGRVVFEVDHPATQRFKRGRVAGLAPKAREVRFVSMDFTRQDLGARLGDEGHDPAAPTFWVWEGVVPYLPEPATRATLEALRARSASGSTLALTYGTADDRLWLHHLAAPVHLGFRILGEPLHGLLSEAALAAMLDETGWTLEDDTGPRDWKRRFGYGRLLTIGERLAVAGA